MQLVSAQKATGDIDTFGVPLSKSSQSRPKSSGIALGVLWDSFGLQKHPQSVSKQIHISVQLVLSSLIPACFLHFPPFFQFSKCVCKTEKTCMYVLIATDIWGPIDFPLSLPERKKVHQRSQNMSYPPVSLVRALRLIC